MLGSLYTNWNTRINVISRKDIGNIYVNHVLHSLAIAKVFSFGLGAEVADVGTGGGFPGIPLAILFPETRFTLVDSIGKKIRVVKEVIEAADIQNVSAINLRAEQLQGMYDFIVSRAVATLPELLRWTGNKISNKSQHRLPNGLVCLKGGDLSDELTDLKCTYQVYDLKAFFDEPFFESKKLIHLQVRPR